MTVKEELLNRFLGYVKVNTRSDESSQTVPSSSNQVAFLKTLGEELKELGLNNVRHEEDGYLFADLPANEADVRAPSLGFIAHIDTADFNSENIQPQIVKNYDGHSVIKLGQSGYELNPAVFPSLKKYENQTLITTDGNTLLGADDKAGVTEIVTLAHYLLEHPEVKHGDLHFAFGPDEEIGRGAKHFNVADFGADYAFTVDGGPLGELEWETFNAASASVKIQGQNVQPGTAKGMMVNAGQVAIDFHNHLPADERPENTEGRQGFWHLDKITGTPEEAQLHYIIRDHDREHFESRKDKLIQIADKMNQDFGIDRIVVDVQDQYYNMGDILEKDMWPVNLAKKAMLELNIKPVIEPVRGGTDGSIITRLGLPTPNLFAGGENMHGRYEYVSLDVMEQAWQTILKIVELSNQ